MCERITCSDCGKPGFTGCGRHIEQVLGDVEWEDRCQCEPKVGPMTWLGQLIDSAID
ncbi:MAG: hypothetical protein HOV80_27775, partial [Polyangiaceae bacterium]|nr:hypothetical protein [Polyangiaceae bacterium]